MVCAVSQGQAKSVRKAVEGNPRQKYFLIDHSEGKAPTKGYKLLVVLPGGHGGADFNPFVTNISKQVTGEDYLVAQLISVKWTPEQKIVWPTKKSPVDEMAFTTEEFIRNVIHEIGKQKTIDPDHIYTLTWSSSGPAAYTASLSVPEIKGSFVAMSVFHAQQLPNLAKAKGHRYYLFHSPEDKVCPLRLAKEAADTLAQKGATVKFVTYQGGHGWHGDVFGSLRQGITWLEQR